MSVVRTLLILYGVMKAAGGICGTSVVEKVPVMSKNKAHEGGYVGEKKHQFRVKSHFPLCPQSQFLMGNAPRSGLAWW